MTRPKSGGRSDRTMTPARRHGRRWQARTEGRRSRGEAAAAGKSERAKDGRPWQRPGRAQGGARAQMAAETGDKTRAAGKATGAMRQPRGRATWPLSKAHGQGQAHRGDHERVRKGLISHGGSEPKSKRGQAEAKGEGSRRASREGGRRKAQRRPRRAEGQGEGGQARWEVHAKRNRAKERRRGSKDGQRGEKQRENGDIRDSGGE